MDVRKTLISPLPGLDGGGKQAVHRADGREVDATFEKRRVDLRGRLVGELGKMKRIEHELAFGVAESSRIRRAWSRHAGRW